MAQMNASVALAYALSLIAQSEGATRKVVCLCTYCYNDVDPKWDHPTHLAPNDSECERCTNVEDWRRGGFVFAVLPSVG